MNIIKTQAKYCEIFHKNFCFFFLHLINNKFISFSYRNPQYVNIEHTSMSIDIVCNVRNEIELYY